MKPSAGGVQVPYKSPPNSKRALLKSPTNSRSAGGVQGLIEKAAPTLAATAAISKVPPPVHMFAGLGVFGRRLTGRWEEGFRALPHRLQYPFV
jgi:hypothetical protein